MLPDEPALPTPAATSAPRSHPLFTVLAWLVILSATSYFVVRNVRDRAVAGQEDVRMPIVAAQIQGRYIVGAASLHLPGASAAELFKRIESSLADGPYPVRLRNAILAGELAGPDEALAALDLLEQDVQAGKVKPTPDGPRMAALLVKLYKGFQANPGARPSLSEEEQDDLRQTLGWFGELALAPESSPDKEARQRILAPARRAVFAYFTLLGAGSLGLVVGFALLIIVCVRVWSGQIRSNLHTGATAGGVYAETFALYLVLYGGAGELMPRLGVAPGQLWLSGLVMFACLGVLVWPVLRGLSWQQVREDVGWMRGRPPGLEPVWGLAAYLASWPLLFVAFLVVVGLMFAQKKLGWGDPFTPGGGPSHPLGGVALNATWWTWVQVFLVAAVAAPVVEETFFRGVLYRHLRELTGGASKVLSVAVSALVSGLVFAIIHPQGILGVPVLVTLAITFALLREWRGSLVGPMVAHGVNNGMMMLVLMTMAG